MLWKVRLDHLVFPRCYARARHWWLWNVSTLWHRGAVFFPPLLSAYSSHWRWQQPARTGTRASRFTSEPMAAFSIFNLWRFQECTMPQWLGNIMPMTAHWWHTQAGAQHPSNNFLNTVLFCSLAFLDPRVGHTMDVLSPFISVLCHSDW